MKIPIFQVDAFTSEIFKGNPACVVPLNKWLDDKLLIKIARENNVSETAFFQRVEAWGVEPVWSRRTVWAMTHLDKGPFEGVYGQRHISGWQRPTSAKSHLGKGPHGVRPILAKVDLSYGPYGQAKPKFGRQMST